MVKVPRQYETATAFIIGLALSILGLAMVSFLPDFVPIAIASICVVTFCFVFAFLLVLYISLSNPNA